jgi:hypothetical protein
MLSLSTYVNSTAQIQARGPFHTHCMVLALLIMEEFTVSVKCRTAIKALSMYLNLCLGVKLPKLIEHIYYKNNNDNKICITKVKVLCKQ